MSVKRLSVALMGTASALSIILWISRREAARRGYQDSATQSRIRSALTAEKVWWIDHDSQVTTRPEDLTGFATHLQVRHGDAPDSPGWVYIHPWGNGVVFSAQSASGMGFYLAWDPQTPAIGASHLWGHDKACGPALEQAYSPAAWKMPLSRWQRYRRDRRIDNSISDADRLVTRDALARALQGYSENRNAPPED